MRQRDLYAWPREQLIAGDFTVFEDSVSQPIVSVSRQRIPLGLALLLDTSASMEDLPRVYREVADELATQYLVAYAPMNNARDGNGDG